MDNGPSKQSLRRLFLANGKQRDRIFHHNIWFRGHNNPRQAELLPRLSRVDSLLAVCSDQRLLRGVQFRALWYTRRARYRLVLGAASKQYDWMFVTDLQQIPYFSGRCVVDVDDPRFTPEEVALLNHDNVAAYVVTAERAAVRFGRLGVRTPYHVIPQGVSLRSISPASVHEIAQSKKQPHEVTVGYVAAWHLTSADRNGTSPFYNVEHLLELWERIRKRAPAARLWLIGGASESLRRRCAGRDDIVLFGRVPREVVLDHIANLDIALYPRTEDRGIQAAKVAEYLGLGVPIVTYDLRVTEEVGTVGAGIVVATPAEFVDAVVRLANSPSKRHDLAIRAEQAGRNLDWDLLARRYEQEILDAYLR